MWNFNQEDEDDCCPTCGCNNHSGAPEEVQYLEYQTDLESPEELVLRYVDAFKDQVKCEEDLYIVVGAMFNDVYSYALKKSFISDIDSKMEALKYLDMKDR